MKTTKNTLNPQTAERLGQVAAACEKVAELVCDEKLLKTYNIRQKPDGFRFVMTVLVNGVDYTVSVRPSKAS